MDDTRLMRFSPGYKVIPLQPVLDWSAWNVQNNPATEAISAPGSGGDPAQGFAKAVEMCNNNGHCRKFDAGTMCPSYRVTRDEQHLTRGRANTLRLALSGQLGPEGLVSEAVKDAMDLCVSCKGCRRDCPTGVDMARMKVEFLHHYKQEHGHTLKDKLVARLPDYAHWASRFAPLLNLRNTVPALARLGERWLGFSARRSLPQWKTQTFFNTQQATVSRTEVLAADKARCAVRGHVQRHLRGRQRHRGGSRAALLRATPCMSRPRPRRMESTCAVGGPICPAAWWTKPAPGHAS